MSSTTARHLIVILAFSQLILHFQTQQTTTMLRTTNLGSYQKAQSRIRRVVHQKIYKRSVRSKISKLIPGFRNVLLTKRVIELQLLWLLLIIGFSTLCIYQAISRIIYYSSNPINTFTTVETVKEVTFPSITFAEMNSEKIYNIKKKYSESGAASSPLILCFKAIFLLIDYETPETIWNYSNPINDIQLSLVEGNQPLTPTEKYINTEVLNLPTFQSQRFTLNKTLAFDGRHTRLVIERKNSTVPCILFENIFLVNDPDDYSNFKALYYTGARSDVDVSLSYKQFSRLNTPQKPCVSFKESEKCFHNCLLKKQQKLNITCKLPFMEEVEHLISCKNAYETSATYNLLLPLLISTDREADCNCIRICNEKIYSVLRTANILDLPSNKSVLNFYYPNSHYTLITEKLAYDFISLLCDIGGNLGLYLGLSIITVVEIVESILQLTKTAK